MRLLVSDVRVYICVSVCLLCVFKKLFSSPLISERSSPPTMVVRNEQNKGKERSSVVEEAAHAVSPMKASCGLPHHQRKPLGHNTRTFCEAHMPVCFLRG